MKKKTRSHVKDGEDAEDGQDDRDRDLMEINDNVLRKRLAIF